MEDMYSSPPGQEFDVYFSFSEKDKNRYIADYVSKALVLRGLNTCIDEEQVLERRSHQLARARRESILASRVAILVLSEDYLASDFCLEELVVIMRCRERLGMIVVPVFSYLDPSDMRKTRGVVATSLGRQRVGGCWWARWKNSLQEASDLCGWDQSLFQSHSNFVGHIAEDIMDKRIPSNLKISIYPIGYDTCYEYINLFLEMGSNDVLMVGIGGTSKMGKTMIAKAIYDRIFQAFDGSSFIRDIAKKSKQPNGLVLLQENLLSDVLMGENINVTSVPSGANEIKERMRQKKVLIVLDDVCNLDQLYALVGSRKWFGKGSKIIITTRVLPLLRLFGVDQIFMAQGRTLPLDIIEIWEPYQRSCHQIVGLKGYLESLHYLMKYLEDCLIRERRKTEIQAKRILELKHSKEEESPSQPTSTECETHF